jgi:hypothetical protein
MMYRGVKAHLAAFLSNHSSRLHAATTLSLSSLGVGFERLLVGNADLLIPSVAVLWPSNGGF